MKTTQLRAKEREKDIKGLPDSGAGGWQSNCHCVCDEWGGKKTAKTEKNPPSRGEGPPQQRTHLHPAQVQC